MVFRIPRDPHHRVVRLIQWIVFFCINTENLWLCWIFKSHSSINYSRRQDTRERRFTLTCKIRYMRYSKVYIRRICIKMSPFMFATYQPTNWFYAVKQTDALSVKNLVCSTPKQHSFLSVNHRCWICYRILMYRVQKAWKSYARRRIFIRIN